ncbi:lysophosphatidylserine lipase ABHD12-like [Zophobas morio]|uniref:lysophosphatidylserine lipase ABHD12-like n=1 Tax=Zophobas morio TaxID=2755281 RepID=UPI003082BA4E
MAGSTKRDNDDNTLQLLQSREPQLRAQSNLAMPFIEQEQETSAVTRSNDVVYLKKSLSKKAKKRLKCAGIFLIILLIIVFLLAFVGLPVFFMNSLALQRLIMFTNLGLPSEVSHFRKYELKPGLRNFYVSVKDVLSKDVISLGVWHLLPYTFQEHVITDQNFDYDDALLNSNMSVLLYFHGTGEDRSSSLSKYSIFRFFFHVITFDYRNYADSSKNELSEDAVVNDCVQLYEWLTTKTKSRIIIWGHSLGSALATHTVSLLQTKPNVTQPVGLVLEAAFTKMSEELYVHPYGKIFAWLPWFKATILRPLEKNGFLFDTSKNILNVECPVMILCAEDDSIVPYKFGQKIREIAQNRSVLNTTFYYQFDYNLNYDHFFIYQDPFIPYFINYFQFVCTDGRSSDI